MRQPKLKHWQDLVSVLVGAWLVAAPWLLGIHGHLAAVANCVVLGAVLLGFTITEFFLPEPWEEWAELVIGAWLIGSPWVLEFTSLRTATQNAIGCGTLLVVLALWVLATDRGFGGWFQRRRAH